MALTVLPDNVFRELTLILIVLVLIICVVLAGIFCVIRFIFYPILIKPMYHMTLQYIKDYQANKLNNTVKNE